MMTEKEGTRGLALEGGFSVKYESEGFSDTMGETLYYMNIENELHRGFKISFKDASAFFCVWSQKPKGYYNLNTCQRRLLLEPVKVLEYWEKSSGKLDEDKKKCTCIISRGVSADNAVATISYLEAVWLLQILEHHLEHLSRSYFSSLKRYYAKIVPKLNGNVTPNIYKDNNSFEALSSTLLERTLHAIYFYIGENWALEEMRQEYLHFNAGRIEEVRKKEDPKYLDTPRFYTATIKFSKHIYEFWVDNEIDIVLVNQIDKIFAPLFFVKVTSPQLQYCYFGINNTTNKITGAFLVNYYNNSASTWEPLIEPFIIQYNSSKRAGDELLKLEIQSQVNINITEDFLLMMEEYWKSSNLDAKKSEERFVTVMGNTPISERPLGRAVYETASNYAIYNQTGETLSISILDYPNPQKILVFPNDWVNLCTKPSDEVKSYFLSGSRTFRIKVEFPPKLRIEPMYCVNLSSVGSFEHKYGRHFFQCTNKIVNTQKVLTIATSFQLKNELDIPIIVCFHKLKDSKTRDQKLKTPKANSSESILKKEYVVKSNATLSIPFSLIEVPTSISLKRSESSGSQFTFLKLSETLTNPKHMLQIKIEDNFYVILSLQADAKSTVTKVSVWTPLCIKNCLSVPLKIQSVRNEMSIQLKESETSILHKHPLNYEDTLEITIPGFKKTILEYDLGITSYTFKMVDYEMNELKLHMEIMLNNKARYLILFYAECTIHNLTKDHLIFFITTKVILS